MGSSSISSTFRALGLTRNLPSDYVVILLSSRPPVPRPLFTLVSFPRANLVIYTPSIHFLVSLLYLLFLLPCPL